MTTSFKAFLITILICMLGFEIWYYRPQINSQMMNVSSHATYMMNSSLQQANNAWVSLVYTVKGFNFSFLRMGQGTNTKVADNTAIQPTANYVTNCGTGIAPRLDLTTTSPDPVLSCLGVSAFNCQNASGILKDDLFPTIFEIIRSGNSCNFKLSYGRDSTLTDATGKKLALQSITCPLSVVKAIDNTNPDSPKFVAPNKTALSTYASQIYMYGTLGVFVQNNLDQNKIQNLGCSGAYIQSVIASYNSK